MKFLWAIIGVPLLYTATHRSICHAHFLVYGIRHIPVVTSILIFVHNTYLFVFRWYFPMTKISIEVIDISRQISLVNRSRDHLTIIETYLQYFITLLVSLQRKFITFSVAFYLVEIREVFHF